MSSIMSGGGGAESGESSGCVSVCSCRVWCVMWLESAVWAVMRLGLVGFVSLVLKRKGEMDRERQWSRDVCAMETS